jgi:putative membrane protein insertion efficiency factor
MTRILLAAIGFYKRWLSPALHSLGAGGCKFRPTCSEYAAEAITIHGAVRGTVLAVGRLVRCHPFSAGGFDPVPLPHAHSHPSPHEPLP